MDRTTHLVVDGTTPRTWGHVRKLLSACAIIRDGDAEGAFALDHLPDPIEAEAIRDALLIPRRRHLSAEQRGHLRRIGFQVTAEGVPSTRDGHFALPGHLSSLEPPTTEKTPKLEAVT